VQFPVLERFGFEGSRKGVAQSVAAFRPFNGHVEVAERNARMQFLVNPPLQDEEFKKKVQKSAAPVQFSMLRLADRYQDDPLLVSLARKGDLQELAARVGRWLSWLWICAFPLLPAATRSNPNTIVPDRLDFLREARSRFYFIEEKTALMAALEEGHKEIFDFLVSHLWVDVNAVCCEWSLSAAYKTYTALDVGQVLVRAGQDKGAKRMVRQLLARGGKSAETLPLAERENPFLKWKEHFPDGDIDNIGAEFATGSTNYGPNYGPAPAKPKMKPAPPPAPAPEPVQPACSPWQFPPHDESSTELNGAIAALKQRLLAQGVQDKPRLLRQLFLEWHPDKRLEEAELATQVFQWLQAVK
ncbi:unnamed protein product, partial [Effrenium voratum]